MKNDQAVNEIIGSILIVILVIALAAVIVSLFLGLVDLAPKSAFIAPDITNQTITGKNVIKLYNKGGDTATLNMSGQGHYAMGVYIDSSTGSTRAIPLLQTLQFRPGDTLYVYNWTNGYGITNNISDLSASSVRTLPPGNIGIRLVDENSHNLIAKWNLSVSGSSPAPVSPPAASFTGSPLVGNVPLAVQFTDTSTGAPTAWSWNFGDGYTGTAQNPAHTYTSPGTYTVSLNATNGGGSNTKTQTGYITATEPGFTAEAWVRWTKNPTPTSDDQRWAMIVVDGDNDANRVYQIGHDQLNTRFEFRIATVNTTANPWGGMIQSDVQPLAGVWYHVAEVYNQTPGAFNIYVNGVKQVGIGVWSPDNSGMKSSTGIIQRGGPEGIYYNWAPGQRKFDGDIRGLKTYQGALSPQQILEHYQAGVPLS